MTGSSISAKTVSETNRGVVVGTLKITSEYAGLEFVAKTYDSGQCSATFKFFKQPGHEFFEGSQVTNGEHMFKTDMRLENCPPRFRRDGRLCFRPP